MMETPLLQSRLRSFNQQMKSMRPPRPTPQSPVSSGEPARLVDDSGQDITVLLRSITMLEEAEVGRRLVVDIRAENRTDEAQNSPEWEVWCGNEQMPFYGGTYDWQIMPGGTFLEGTREFGYPESCSAPELRALHLASFGESVRWDVTP